MNRSRENCEIQLIRQRRERRSHFLHFNSSLATTTTNKQTNKQHIPIRTHIQTHIHIKPHTYTHTHIQTPHLTTHFVFLITHRYGAWRVNGVLSVARAIGDKKLKQWVIGVPGVNEFTMDGTEEYIVIACDGLWDCMSHQEVVDFIAKHKAEHGRKVREGKEDEKSGR